MAAAAERTDELVREYLLFRGFTAALKQLDAEIKADREKGFRVSQGRGLGGAGVGAVCVYVCVCGGDVLKY